MKNPITSKTLWANLLGIGALLAQAKLGYVFAPEDQAIALAAINLVMRLITKQPLNWSAPIKNQAGKARHVLVFLLLVCSLIAVMTLPLLPGCSTLTGKIANDDLATQFVVRATAGRVLDKHPNWIKETYRITSEVLHLGQQDQLVSLADLEQAVVERVHWKRLNLEEQDLLRALIASVRLDLERYQADRGVSDPGQSVVLVLKVLDWINQSAMLRLPQADQASLNDSIIDRAVEDAATIADLRTGVGVYKARMRGLYAGRD